MNSISASIYGALSLEESYFLPNDARNTSSDSLFKPNQEKGFSLDGETGDIFEIISSIPELDFSEMSLSSHLFNWECEEKSSNGLFEPHQEEDFSMDGETESVCKASSLVSRSSPTELFAANHFKSRREVESSDLANQAKPESSDAKPNRLSPNKVSLKRSDFNVKKPSRNSLASFLAEQFEGGREISNEDLCKAVKKETNFTLNRRSVATTASRLRRRLNIKQRFHLPFNLNKEVRDLLKEDRAMLSVEMSRRIEEKFGIVVGVQHLKNTATKIRKEFML